MLESITSIWIIINAGLMLFQRGWVIIDLSVGLIIIYVGLKLNCGIYVGLEFFLELMMRGSLRGAFYFIVGKESYEFLLL